MAKTKNTTLEKAKKELKDIGGKIAKGTKKIYTLAELTAKKQKLENANAKAFQEIGRLTYNKGKMTGKPAELGEKIKDNKKKIADINKELKKMKK